MKNNIFKEVLVNIGSQKRIVAENARKYYIRYQSDSGFEMLGCYDAQESAWIVLYDAIDIDDMEVYNAQREHIYFVNVADGEISIRLNQDEVWGIQSVLGDEYLLDVVCEDGILLVKTGYDREGEQEVRVYLIDVEERQCYHIQDSKLTGSICMAHIVNINNTRFMVLEHAKYVEHEQREIYDLYGEEHAQNEILYVEFDELMRFVKGNETIKWKCLEKGGRYISVRILGIESDHLITARVDWEHQYTDITYRNMYGKEEKSIGLPSCITYYNCVGDKVFISWGNNFDIYTLEGDLLGSFDFAMESARQGIELNTVLAVLEGKRIVYDATEIKNDYAQIRVVYDMNEKQICFYDTEILQYKEIVI